MSYTPQLPTLTVTTTASSTAALLANRRVLVGVTIAESTVAGELLLTTVGSTGTTLVRVPTGKLGATVHVPFPGGGIVAEQGVYATLTAVSGAAVYYLAGTT